MSSSSVNYSSETPLHAYLSRDKYLYSRECSDAHSAQQQQLHRASGHAHAQTREITQRPPPSLKMSWRVNGGENVNPGGQCFALKTLPLCPWSPAVRIRCSLGTFSLALQQNVKCHRGACQATQRCFRWDELGCGTAQPSRSGLPPWSLPPQSGAYVCCQWLLTQRRNDLHTCKHIITSIITTVSTHVHVHRSVWNKTANAQLTRVENGKVQLGIFFVLLVFSPVTFQINQGH